MTQVSVKYNPYRLETELKVNGQKVPKDSLLYKVTKGKRLQEWIGEFPKMLRDELNTVALSLEYCGMALDWDDFEDAFEHAEKAGIVKVSGMRYIAGKSDDDINEKIVKVFQDLQEGPISDFRDPKLVKCFEEINNTVFSVHVIATMSSGKSTLINALLGKNLMPSQNEACTATITEILDSDAPAFSATVYGSKAKEEDKEPVSSNFEVLEEVSELTHEIMERLNQNPHVQLISADGNIPFLDAKDTALKLVDTPGPNNAQNQAHKNTTYRAINNDSNSLILYVLNATQLSTNDDARLLHYVADQIRKGGKQMRDRFLFVINKMDQFNPETEDIESAILAAKHYLAAYGIEEPQLFPCSALTALNLETSLKGIDIEQLTRAEEKTLPISARETLTMVDKLNGYDSMHLEKYTTLSPSAQQELNYRLSQAVEKGDANEQALIHSGICSIQSAITAYVKKYAKTKKIKDLVESFQEVLESSQILVKAKTQVAEDAASAKACAERAAVVRQKIADGKEAQAFKKKIEALDPVPEIEKKANQLSQNAAARTNRIFSSYGDVIDSREEAKRLVVQFSTMSSDAMAELTSELESTINHEIVSTGERLMKEYQDKLTAFDESAADSGRLDFQTVDLIKGALRAMRDTAESWTSDDFATETIEDIGETTYVDRKYYEKTGQKEEEEVTGSHEEKVATKKVLTGSHRVKVGTRMVRNPKKSLIKPWTWFAPKYIEEDVYETVDDYKYEDVYKTVLEYKTVVRDIYEERHEQIEKFSVKTALLQQGLIAKMRRSLDEGIEKALGYAADQIAATKKQFSDLFDKLDETISKKYAELEDCARDETEKQKRLEENQQRLDWIETNIREINSILDI